MSKEIRDCSFYRDRKPVLKLDFTAHGTMKSLSEFESSYEHEALLKVPKCEILDRSDFHNFYTKAFLGR